MSRTAEAPTSPKTSSPLPLTSKPVTRAHRKKPLRHGEKPAASTALSLRLQGPVFALPALLFAAGLSVSCSEAIELAEPEFYAQDVEGRGDAGTQEEEQDAGGSESEQDFEGPVVRIVAPAEGALVTEDSVRIEGEASDQSGVANVFVSSGPNAAIPAQSSDGYRTWHVDVPVGRGIQTYRAWGVDSRANRSRSEDSIQLEGPAPSADLNDPRVIIDSPEPDSLPLQNLMLIQGRVEDEGEIVEMWVEVDGIRIDERAVETDNFYQDWARLVPLTPGQEQWIEVFAQDAAGRTGSARIRLQAPAVRDGVPPEVVVDTPATGLNLSDESWTFLGRASDAFGIREVRLRLRERDAATWSTWRYAETTDGYGTWQLDMELPAGELEVEARAVDLNGIAQSTWVEFSNTPAQSWTQRETWFLRLREREERPRLNMVLDRVGIEEVIPPAVQQEVVMLELDPLPLLTNSLEIIKDACGTSWRQDNRNPNHNCNLSPLGQSFVGPDGTWETSPEYAMVRILTMTPANVHIEGTSIEGLANIADGSILGITIGGGFSSILSEALGIGRTEEIISTESVAIALKERVIASHPAAELDGSLSVTLYDALRDMEPLADVFAQNGRHPGIVDPAFPTYAQLMDDDFALRLVGESNLRWVDGLDLDQGKEYMAYIDDQIGPTYNDVLEFDFNDEERFAIEGLVESPELNLRFILNEDDRFVPSCNGDDSCQDNLPGSPTSTGSYWALEDWLFEHVMAYAGYSEYQTRSFQKCYINLLGCQADVRIAQDANPLGWANFDILFNLGNPPEDQYLWELITEVGQVALHRLPETTIPEGQANMAFDLRDIPVGLSADDVREQTRPYLQEQRSDLSDLLLGEYDENNGALDIYYRRGDSGAPLLVFVNDEDPLPSGQALSSRPGFFSGPELREDQRVSSLTMSGEADSTHQKVRLLAGETTLYAQSAEGDIYRLEIRLPEAAVVAPSEIEITTSRLQFNSEVGQ